MKAIVKFISLLLISIMVNTAYSSPVLQTEYNEAKNYIDSYKKKIDNLIFGRGIKNKSFKSCASVDHTREYGIQNFDNYVGSKDYNYYTSQLEKSKCSFYLNYKEDLKAEYSSSQKIVKAYEKERSSRKLSLIHKDLNAIAHKLKAKGVQVSVDKKPSSIKNAEKMLSILNNKLVDIHNSEQAIEEKQIKALEQQVARQGKQQKNVPLKSVEEPVKTNANSRLPPQSVASGKEIGDNSTSNTISKLILLLVGGWILFSVIYSLIKGRSGEVIVFADYTDATLTFLSITVFPLLISIISMMFEKELGDTGSTIVGFLVFAQFVAIQYFAFRNLLYLNQGSIFTSVVSLTGRLVLSVLFLATFARIFDDKRKTFDRILYLIFTVFLGKVIKSLIAKQEFSPIGNFFDSKILKARFSEEYLSSMSFKEYNARKLNRSKLV